MSTLHQLRDGLSRAWDSITVGWRELRERAGDALTRFVPQSTTGELQTGEDGAASRSSRWGLLAAEVRADNDSVQVKIEAPGLNADDIHVEVIDDVLVVRGEKKVEREQTRGHYHIMERAYGQFERAIRLPAAVEDDGAQATYRKGVLTVTLQKSQTAGPRRITVEKR